MNRTAFRRAAALSAVLHAVAVGAVFLLLRVNEAKQPLSGGIDTRADQAQVRIHDVEVVEEVMHTAPQAVPQVTEPPAMPISDGPPLAASRTAPQLLPSELLTLIRKQNTFTKDTNMKPAGRAGTSNGAKPGVPAMHGALKPNQTVVYILDSSGSMGAAGKLDAARAALVATLQQQPPTVRFQVIVYAGSARPLLASDRSGLPVTAANTQAAAEQLGTLDARGPSNHAAALQAALAFRPDVIVMLTDAEDLTAALLKPVLASSPKPVMLCVGHVNADGVQRPHELR